MRGRKGLLFLLIEACFVREHPTVARGTFEIVDGTGVYTGLRGRGEYRAAIDRIGEPVEALHGRLHGDP